MQQNLLIIVCIFIICIDPKIDFYSVKSKKKGALGCTGKKKEIVVWPSQDTIFVRIED